MLLIFLIAGAGAVLQEALWWYTLHRRLAVAEYSQLISSRFYWGLVATICFLSGVVALIWFPGGDLNEHLLVLPERASARDVLVFGAFLPSILKQAARSVGGPRDMGDPEAAAGDTLKRYLGP